MVNVIFDFIAQLKRVAMAVMKLLRVGVAEGMHNHVSIPDIADLFIKIINNTSTNNLKFYFRQPVLLCTNAKYFYWTTADNNRKESYKNKSEVR